MPHTPRSRRRFFPFSILCLGVMLTACLLDQASKGFIRYRFSEAGPSFIVIPDIFHITLVYNDSAAFDFLAFISQTWRMPIILFFSLAALTFLTYFSRTAPDKIKYQLPLGMVIGGALGNLIDRLRFGAVVDFLQVGWKQWTWPVFNVADSCISTGILILLWVLWREPDPERD